MSFVQKPNTGTLWPNDRKTAPNQPDVRGDIAFDKAFLKDMLNKAEDDLVKIQIAGWNKVIAGKSCVSMTASAPYVKPAGQPSYPSKSVPDEDIPF